MTKFRLKEQHPVHQKVEKLFQYMEDEGLSLEILSGHMFVKVAGDERTFRFQDTEYPHGGNETPPTSLPIMFDWELTFSKED